MHSGAPLFLRGRQRGRNPKSVSTKLLNEESGTDPSSGQNEWSGGLVHVDSKPSSGFLQTHNISAKTEFSRKQSTYIVIPCRPARVQLHVKLSFLPGQLVVLCLFFPGQGMPLWGT